jgi:hypothetical protein
VNKTFSLHLDIVTGVVESPELNVKYTKRFAGVSTVSLFSPLIFRLHGIAALTPANFQRRVGHHEKRNVLAFHSFHHIHRSLIAYYISRNMFAANFELASANHHSVTKVKTVHKSLV